MQKQSTGKQKARLKKLMAHALVVYKIQMSNSIHTNNKYPCSYNMFHANK